MSISKSSTNFVKMFKNKKGFINCFNKKKWSWRWIWKWKLSILWKKVMVLIITSTQKIRQ